MCLFFLFHNNFIFAGLPHTDSQPKAPEIDVPINSHDNNWQDGIESKPELPGNGIEYNMKDFGPSRFEHDSYSYSGPQHFPNYQRPRHGPRVGAFHPNGFGHDNYRHGFERTNDNVRHGNFKSTFGKQRLNGNEIRSYQKDFGHDIDSPDIQISFISDSVIKNELNLNGPMQNDFGSRKGGFKPVSIGNGGFGHGIGGWGFGLGNHGHGDSEATTQESRNEADSKDSIQSEPEVFANVVVPINFFSNAIE